MGMYSVNLGVYNKQKAIGYIAYMIIGSYFEKTRPGFVFRNWKLDYAELSDQQKFEKEELADRLMGRLGEEFLTAISGLRCEAIPRWNGSDLEIRFLTGGFEAVICTVSPKGRLEIQAVP